MFMRIMFMIQLIDSLSCENHIFGGAADNASSFTETVHVR